MGTQTVHALADRDINAAQPGAGNTGRPLYAAFKRTVATTMWDGFLNASYHALQVGRIVGSRRGSIKGAYTFSKPINETDEDGWAGIIWNSDNVMRRNRSLTGYDRTHVLQLGWVIFEPPFGPGKRSVAAKRLRFTGPAELAGQ